MTYHLIRIVQYFARVRRQRDGVVVPLTNSLGFQQKSENLSRLLWIGNTQRENSCESTRLIKQKEIRQACIQEIKTMGKRKKRDNEWGGDDGVW